MKKRAGKGSRVVHKTDLNWPLTVRAVETRKFGFDRVTLGGPGVEVSISPTCSGEVDEFVESIDLKGPDRYFVITVEEVDPPEPIGGGI